MFKEYAMQNTAQTLQTLERKFWQSLVDEDFNTAEALLGDPALIVSTHGSRRIDHAGYRQMAKDGSMKVKSFELGDMDVLLPSDSTAILTYDVKQVVERNGQVGRIAQQMHDTSTWIRKGDSWKCVAHTETPAASRTEQASGAQDLLHRPALRQLVHQLVEIADLLHQRIRHFFHAHAAHHALDQRALRVHRRRAGEELLEAALPA